MKILFKNANILNKNFDLIKNQDLLVDGNRIKYIKNTCDSILKEQDVKFDRVIDCKNYAIIPGFKNAHTHNGMTFARSLADDLSLQDWLYKTILTLEDCMTKEDSYYFTLVGIMENLRTGVTECMEMYKFNRFLTDIYYRTGMRVNIQDSITMFDKVVEPEELYNDLKNYKGDNGNRIKYTFGLHAEYTNNEKTFQFMSDLVHKYKAPCFSHNSETIKEVEECKARWGGLTPTEVHEKYGLYDYGGGGIHCVHLSDEDVEIFKKHNLTIVLNVASNLKLNSGIAPVCKYLKEGINLTIGTDGPASNNAIDIFREMYLIAVLSKYIKGDVIAVSAKDIVKMATVNAEKALRTYDASYIDTGMLADLVLIDMKKPNMQPENDFVNNLVYACSKDNVYLTMVDGKVLYEDGKFFIGEDEEYVYKKSKELLKNLIDRVEKKKL